MTLLKLSAGVVCAVLLAGYNGAATAATRDSLLTRVGLRNPYAFARVDEVIQIPASYLHIPSGRYPAVFMHGKRLVTQTTAVDTEGSWKTLLVRVSLKAHSADTIAVYSSTQPYAFEQKTNVLLTLKSKDGKPGKEIKEEERGRGFIQNISDPKYQMEGPGIENDKVAFRCFFDYRNGKDIYGKITGRVILDQVGLSGTWHEMQPWGMDILKVGESLGAGGLGIIEKGKLFRLGDADNTKYTALYKGPLQARLQLSFKGWDTGTTKSDGSETVSMTSGDFFYSNNINVEHLAGKALTAGIAYFGNYPVVVTRHNAKYISVSTYGPQAEGTATALGLALMLPAKDYIAFKKTGKTGDLSNTVYPVLRYHAGKPFTLYFFACWEKSDKRFATRAGFNNYMAQTARRLAYPITIFKLK